MDALSFLQNNWLVLLIVGLILLSMRKKSGSSVQVTLGFEPAGRAQMFQGMPSTTKAFSTTTVEITSNDPIFPEMMKALQSGDKIGAIKMLREAKNLDLTTAKQIIDVLDRHRDPMRSNP